MAIISATAKRPCAKQRSTARAKSPTTTQRLIASLNSGVSTTSSSFSSFFSSFSSSFFSSSIGFTAGNSMGEAVANRSSAVISFFSSTGTASVTTASCPASTSFSSSGT